MGNLLKKTIVKWLFGSNSFEHAAALAYMTLFSMAPILLMAIGVAGIVLGRSAAEGRVFEEIRNLIGPEAARLIQTGIQHAAFGTGDIVATVVGGVLFLLGATGIFAQLKHSLNAIWSVGRSPKINDVFYFLKARLLSLIMVLLLGIFLLAFFILGTLLTGFGNLISGYLLLPPWLLGSTNVALSLLILTLFFAAIFKVLPDVRIQWKDIWVGAAITSLLFIIGRYLISLYITRSSLSGVYGASASLVVILIWVYYSSLILFLGAVFIQVYAEHRGHAVRLAKNAVWLRSRKVYEGEETPI